MRLFSKKKENTSIVRKQTITTKDIKGRWPFHTKEVTVYCMTGASVYCEVKGSNYALNGFSAQILKLKDILDTNLVKSEYLDGQKVKYSIGAVIDFGLALFTEKEVKKLRKIHSDLIQIKKEDN